MGMEKQNVTLSLPKSLLREAKILAVERGISLSQLLAEALEELLRRRREYERARKRHSAILKKGVDLGTGGKVQVRREELHERRPNLR